jgi:hypothetical protein
VDEELREEHFQQSHHELWSQGLFHSEFYPTIASLLGMELEERYPGHFTCPLPHCTDEISHPQDLLRHFNDSHSELTRLLYENVGIFWTVITIILTSPTYNDLHYTLFPTIDELFMDNNGNVTFNLIPITFDRARELYSSNGDIDAQSYSPLSTSPLQFYKHSSLTTVVTYQIMESGRVTLKPSIR